VGAPVIRASARVNHADDERARGSGRPARARRPTGLAAARRHDRRRPAQRRRIATSIALLATLEDVRPLLEGRPAFEHARRIAPAYPGQAPRVFPQAWLQV
jgi:hypothetical protein